jgi:hypothetical protein
VQQRSWIQNRKQSRATRTMSTSCLFDQKTKALKRRKEKEKKKNSNNLPTISCEFLQYPALSANHNAPSNITNQRQKINQGTQSSTSNV